MLTAVILDDANSIRKSVLGLICSWSSADRVIHTTIGYDERLFIPRRRTHSRFSSTSCSLFVRVLFRFRVMPWTGSILISSSISYHDEMRTFEGRISYVFNTVWNSYLCAAVLHYHISVMVSFLTISRLIIRRVSSRRSREVNGRNYSSGRKDTFFVARLHLGEYAEEHAVER
jgi:hypothetical protein